MEIVMTKAYSYIRFSTPDQMKGDSLRRQMEISKKYAETNDLEFDESLTIQDLGISAYKSTNAKRGNLGLFLKAVESGRVDKGSYLLIESLDRLSRDTVFEAMSQFISIINDGIVIVTLVDDRAYKKGSINENELMFSLMSMSRAHEESKMKGYRISSAWSNKRKNSHVQKLTARCPAWLELSQDRSTFNEIKNRTEVVKSIFEMTINGLGKSRITRRLNENSVPVFGRGKGWHDSYVHKILNNRAVLGEFQAHKLENGKRIACDEPVKDYFPTIISGATFQKAQASTLSRRFRAGPTGTKISNLFTGLCKCAYCGSPMRFQDKGKLPRGGKRLVCSSAIRGYGCEITKGWRYDHFEKAALANLSELNIDEVLNDESRNADLRQLKEEIGTTADSLLECQIRLKRVTDAVMQTDQSPSSFVERANRLEVEESQLTSQLELLKADLERKGTVRHAVEQQKNDITVLLGRLDQLIGDELFDLRAKLAQVIRELVEFIAVYPKGDITSEEGTSPCYMVKIRNGGTQWNEPDSDNPLTQYIMLRKVPKPEWLASF